MAKAQYIGVNGVARKVKKDYIGVGGVARKVKSGYIGVDGVARKFFSGFDLATLPFTYTGTYHDRGVETMQDGIFRVIEFTSNGTLTFGQSCIADIFTVGGGASGEVRASNPARGGGGGYTTTLRDIAIVANASLSVYIGNGGRGIYSKKGARLGESGGDTYCTYNGNQIALAKGGACPSGGSGGGGGFDLYSPNPGAAPGGSDGGNGGGNLGKGTGQGTTTREFGLSNGTLYSGGGGGSMMLSDDGDEIYTIAAGGYGGGGPGVTFTMIDGPTIGDATFYGGGGGAYRTAHGNATSGAGYKGICIFRIKAGA